MVNIYERLYEKSSKLSVLYVEDDRLVQASTQELLNDFFERVDTAYNGLEGLERYNEYKEKTGNFYDLVITDINMPQMNGVEMIEKMKPINEKQEFIVISAHNESNYLMDLIELNVNSFVLKPIQSNSLINKLYAIANKLCIEKNKEQYLIKQNKLARMGDMIDMIAHQWLNQLGVLKMRLQAAEFEIELATDVNEYVSECIKQQHEGQDFLEETLKEFRSFFENSSLRTIVSSNDLIQSAQFLMKGTLTKNCISLVNKSKEDIQLSLNKNEFKHIFINLIQNSIDAFKDNNVDTEDRVITIDCSRVDNYVVFDYRDKAGGIPEHMIEDIFEPRVTTKSYGTGMGTYLAKLIIDKHEGKISVSNTQDGANFRILLKGDI